jgi:hypothetical protein
MKHGTGELLIYFIGILLYSTTAGLVLTIVVLSGRCCEVTRMTVVKKVFSC